MNFLCFNLFHLAKPSAVAILAACIFPYHHNILCTRGHKKDTSSKRQCNQSYGYSVTKQDCLAEGMEKTNVVDRLKDA